MYSGRTVLKIGNAAASGTLRLTYVQPSLIHTQLQLQVRSSRGLHAHGRPAVRWCRGRLSNTSIVTRDVLKSPSRNYHVWLTFRRAFSSAYITRLFSNKSVRGFSTSQAASGASGSKAAVYSSTAGSDEGEFELVYRGPLRSAVRAVKVFSLTTCAIALVGGPFLVMMGNPSVPLVGRVLMTSFVMLIGISTTLILHWLMKGYVIKMYYDPKSEHLRVYTLTMFAGKRGHTFHLSEAGPPESLAAFSTFQAQGKSYFMHTEVWDNKELLGKILGAHMALENSELWERDKSKTSKTVTSSAEQDKT